MARSGTREPEDSLQSLTARTEYNGVMVPRQLWEEIQEALNSADSILSLLHYRHRNELSELNRQDVQAAQDKARRVNTKIPAQARLAVYR